MPHMQISLKIVPLGPRRFMGPYRQISRGVASGIVTSDPFLPSCFFRCGLILPLIAIAYICKMSCGISISDVAVLVELAWTTVEGAKKACGEESDLRKGIRGSHMTLEHLHSELSNPESVLNSAKGGRRKDLEIHIRGCRRHLRRINSILVKHDNLHSGNGRPWQRIQLGSEAIKDVSKCALKLAKYTAAITLTLHLLSLGSQGKVEKELSHLRGELKGMRASINIILAKQNMGSRGETRDGLIPANLQDEKEYWHSFWRQLAREGFKTNAICSHKDLIKAYVKELDERGVLDDKILRAQSTPHLSSELDQAESDSSSSSSGSSSRCYQSTVDDFDNLSIDEENLSKTPTREQPTSLDQGGRAEPTTLTGSDTLINEITAPGPEVFAPRPIRPSPTIYSSDRSSTPPPPKQKFTLSVLLFSSKRKSKRAANVTGQSPQPRKRHKRLPPPPRPVSPSPPPPTWWLEERQRRRPPGFERGRSPPPPPSPPPSPPPPPPFYPINVVYSRTVTAYPNPNYYGGLVYDFE
ncbi:hypothetical protein BKA65DRAFT_592584 [Rhexocercosporidium sp. MPI-PUGE-AT-0058]|nr:hypothetical protein BKA65DRAFT_592584 [Rhexocercosporidium sp. MPI-PUGE-AT-0058]